MCGGTTGVHLQFAFLVNGGEIRQTTFLDNLPAVTVYNSARRRTAVVHILVPPIQRGIQCVTMYSRPEALGKACHAQYRQSAELWCSDHRIEARRKAGPGDGPPAGEVSQ